MNVRRSPRWRGGWSAVLAAVASIMVAAAAALVAVTVAATPASAAGTGTGYLHTNGNKIVDSTGATVRITGLNWFGMETDNHTFHGLWAQVTWKSMIDHMAQLGYNTIRVPYTGDSLRSGAQATATRRCRSWTRWSTTRGRRGCGSSSTGTVPAPPGRPRSGTPRASPRRA